MSAVFSLLFMFLLSWRLVYGEVVASPGQKKHVVSQWAEENTYLKHPETSWKLQVITHWHPQARFEVSAFVFQSWYSSLYFQCLFGDGYDICYHVVIADVFIQYFHVIPNVEFCLTADHFRRDHQSHTPPASARVRLGCCLLFHCLDPNANPHPSAAVLGRFRGHGCKKYIEDSPVIRPPAPTKKCIVY